MSRCHVNPPPWGICPTLLHFSSRFIFLSTIIQHFGMVANNRNHNSDQGKRGCDLRVLVRMTRLRILKIGNCLEGLVDKIFFWISKGAHQVRNTDTWWWVVWAALFLVPFYRFQHPRNKRVEIGYFQLDPWIFAVANNEFRKIEKSTLTLEIIIPRVNGHHVFRSNEQGLLTKSPIPFWRFLTMHRNIGTSQFPSPCKALSASVSPKCSPQA